MSSTCKGRVCKRRVPKLAYTGHRGIGSSRDPSTQLPRKHRFDRTPQERARILYHQSVSEHLDGKANEPSKPGPKLKPLGETPRNICGIAPERSMGLNLLWWPARPNSWRRCCGTEKRKRLSRPRLNTRSSWEMRMLGLASRRARNPDPAALATTI